MIPLKSINFQNDPKEMLSINIDLACGTCCHLNILWPRLGFRNGLDTYLNIILNYTIQCYIIQHHLSVLLILMLQEINQPLICQCWEETSSVSILVHSCPL